MITAVHVLTWVAVAQLPYPIVFALAVAFIITLAVFTTVHREARINC